MQPGDLGGGSPLAPSAAPSANRRKNQQSLVFHALVHTDVILTHI
jgi:hypothetical protein